MMRRTTACLLAAIGLLCGSPSLWAEHYDTMVGAVSAVLDPGIIRFGSGFRYADEMDGRAMGIPFRVAGGTFPSTEADLTITYEDPPGGESFRWGDFRFGAKIGRAGLGTSPSYAFLVETHVPLQASERWGIGTGILFSSGIVDIDFSVSLGALFVLKEEGETESRPHSIRFSAEFSRLFLRYLKGVVGVRLNQYLPAEYRHPVTDATITEDARSAWTVVLGPRVKPEAYPVVFDTAFSFGAGGGREEYWGVAFLVQLIPQNPDAEW